MEINILLSAIGTDIAENNKNMGLADAVYEACRGRFSNLKREKLQFNVTLGNKVVSLNDRFNTMM